MNFYLHVIFQGYLCQCCTVVWGSTDGLASISEQPSLGADLAVSHSLKTILTLKLNQKQDRKTFPG